MMWRAISVRPSDSGKGGNGPYQIPNGCKKRALSSLHLVPVITAPLPVDPSMKYGEVGRRRLTQ